MEVINFKLNEEPLNIITMAMEEAIEAVLEAFSEDKGDEGKVTCTIALSKTRFLDGYKKNREGVDIKFKCDSAITNKSTYSYAIPTDQMMLVEAQDFGWQLVPAPDPQMKIDDYMN